MIVTVTVDNRATFFRAFEGLESLVDDARRVWPLLADVFYDIMEGQFASEGARGPSGDWEDLTPAYAAAKAVKAPGKPLLQLSGDLKESLTTSSGTYSVYDVRRKDEMSVGSSHPAATPHQRGSDNGVLPARSLIDLRESDEGLFFNAIRSHLVGEARRLGFEVV